MNPKLKQKIIIDIALTLLTIILMVPAVSGIFAHEWLGVIIAVALGAHLWVNRQWISSVSRRFFKDATLDMRLNYLMNIMLTLTMGMTLLSGVLISQYLFAPLAAANLDLWIFIHGLSSCATLGIIVVHVLMHLSWIRNAYRAVARQFQQKPVQTAFVRVALGLFAIGAVYSVLQTSVISALDTTSAISDGGSTSGNGTTSETTVDNSTLNDIDEGSAVVDQLPAVSSGAALSENDTAEAEVTLTQYLSNFTCTACHRHCLLTAPKCSRGDRQVEQYTEQYYTEYGIADSSET